MAKQKSSPFSRKWNSLCSRLGVKPKQFTVLLIITVVAVGGLTAKAMLKPRKAGAEQPAATAADPAEEAAPESAPAPGQSPAATATHQVIHLELQTRPARDPFHPFFLYSESKAGAGGSAEVNSAPQPPPKGLHLKGIIAGEFAVINDDTLGVGDEVQDQDGKVYVIEEIQERRVVLRENGRRAELGYASYSKKKGAGGPSGSGPKK